MDNILKMQDMLKADPQLEKKIIEEANRLYDSREAADAKEALARAVKAGLDIDFTREELDTIFAKAVELSPEQIEAASGGINMAYICGCGFIGGLIGIAAGSPGGMLGSAAGAAVGVIGGGIYGIVTDPDRKKNYNQ